MAVFAQPTANLGLNSGPGAGAAGIAFGGTDAPVESFSGSDWDFVTEDGNVAVDATACIGDGIGFCGGLNGVYNPADYIEGGDGITQMQFFAGAGRGWEISLELVGFTVGDQPVCFLTNCESSQ